MNFPASSIGQKQGHPLWYDEHQHHGVFFAFGELYSFFEKFIGYKKIYTVSKQFFHLQVMYLLPFQDK